MVMDPNRVYVVNAFTGEIYGDFELDIEARQFMKNNLLKECTGPSDDSGEISKFWCYDARGVETSASFAKV